MVKEIKDYPTKMSGKKHIKALGLDKFQYLVGEIYINYQDSRHVLDSQYFSSCRQSGVMARKMCQHSNGSIYPPPPTWGTV